MLTLTLCRRRQRLTRQWQSDRRIAPVLHAHPTPPAQATRQPKGTVLLTTVQQWSMVPSSTMVGAPSFHLGLASCLVWPANIAAMHRNESECESLPACSLLSLVYTSSYQTRTLAVLDHNELVTCAPVGRHPGCPPQSAECAGRGSQRT